MSVGCPACGGDLGASPVIRGHDRLHGVPGEFSVVVCGSCESGRTLPLVTAEELGSLYPDDYNAFALPANRVLHALATGLFRARYARALRSQPLAALGSRPAGRLLDVGSGRGDLGVVLAGRGWRVTGLEPSEDACAEARRRGVPTEQGTLATSAAKLDGGYDAIVFNHSLEHVAEPADDLVIARSLLRDGGLLIVSVPNFGSWQRRRFGPAWFHLDLPRHRSHFTRAGIERLLARTGFAEVATATSVSPDGLPMSARYRVLGRPLGQGVGRYASMGFTVLLTPLTAATGRIAGEGDLLHATAVKAEPGG